MHRKPRPTLTLTDLFTSLSLVAILAALFLPVLSGAQRSDNLELCLSNMRQLGSALYIYMQDYDETMPSALANIPPVNGGSIDVIPYDMQILPYTRRVRSPITRARVFACPNDTTPLQSDPNLAMWDGQFRLHPYLRRSYAYAGAIITQARVDAGQSQPDPNTGMSQWSAGNVLAQMENPAETIALAEAWTSDETGDGSTFVVGSPWGSILTNCDTWKLAGRHKPAQSPLDAPPPGCALDYTQPNRFPSPGHLHIGNYVLADGHARRYTWQQVRSNDFALFKLLK